jgi:HD superfamily phosphohydrolase
LIREHPALRDRLEAFQSGSSEAVADLLEHGRYSCSAIKALVSSQMDCDRLDYLLRDSHSTGTSYGQLDLERILAAFTLAPDGTLALHPKGLMAVEHYLVVRNLMYRSVYSHRLNVVCNWLLNQAIATARRLGPSQVWADPVMAHWLWEPSDLDRASFLANDDIRTGYHLTRWMEEGPEDLADPCGRLLERRLLKATEVSHLSHQERLQVLAEAGQLAEEVGFAAERSCGLQQRQSRGYHPYKGGIRLWDGLNLQALEQRSSLVQSLTQSVELAWLIHPAEVAPRLRRLLNS